MNVHDLIRSNRSVRTFDESVTISREELADFADCARISASAANKQTLKYRLVYEPGETKALLALTKWAGYLPDLKLPPDGHHPTAFIVICHDNAIDPAVAAYQRDVGIAAQSITLAATEAGYNACMIGSFDAGETAKLLGLAENLKPQLVIALGKSAELVVLCNAENGDIKYFRNDAGVHFVPKRSADEVIIG